MKFITRLRQCLCRHSYKAGRTIVHYDGKTGIFTITETCIKCGKQSSFTTNRKGLGLPIIDRKDGDSRGNN